MFIAWEQRNMFIDNLDAMVWERAPCDASRIVPMWEHQFSSSLDPVKGAPQRKSEFM